MGLRTASLRRPNVDVMAPALTETVQGQNFNNLPQKNDLEPASPVNSFEINKYPPSNPIIQEQQNHHHHHYQQHPHNKRSIILNNLNNAAGLMKKTIINNKLLINDLNDDDVDDAASDCSIVINNKNLQVDNNMSLSPSAAEEEAAAASHRNIMDDDHLESTKKKTPNIELTVVNNNSDDSVIVDGTTCTNNTDQLFNSNNVDDDEELLMQQMMKSMEHNSSSTSDLNEVFDMNIEKDLLEQVDKLISMDDDDQPIDDDLETAQKIQESQTKALLTDLERRHCRIERRMDFLKRRCYKLQSKVMGQHVSGEILGVFEQVHRLVRKPKTTSVDLSYSDQLTDNNKPVAMSTNAAKLLARKLEMARTMQANTVARQKNFPKYFGSGSVESSLFRNTTSSSTSGQVNIPQWSNENRDELKKVSEQLMVQLNIVQDSVDSEATESSSGGESCDELQSYNNPHQQYLSIQKRALWKYSTERAAIAARWTWLQSQISDLEYRIRQHSDIHKELRLSKGVVQLLEQHQEIKAHFPTPEIAGHHDYDVTSSAPTNTKTSSSSSSTPLNGYLGQLPGATTNNNNRASTTTIQDPDFCEGCARTRPLGAFKKRRLLQIAGLHAVSKKAARPSTVRCNCVAQKTICALCTGRSDPTHPRDSPDTLGKAEKVALLDPGYHRVLSMLEDTSQTLHFEAIMKMFEWQQRSLKIKTLKSLHKSERIETRPYEHRNKKLEHRKKYSRLKNNTTVEKLKKPVKLGKGRPAKYIKKSYNQDVHNNETGGSDDAEVEATISRTSQLITSNNSTSQQGKNHSFDSPGGSPLLHMQSISGFKQNNRASRIDSYDIDNIVIPYSVAATTRVEKLPYKEILTPKWRLAEEELLLKIENKNNGNSVISILADDSDYEDLSEESVIGRHDRSEVDEKKRFLSYIKFPLSYGGRQRSHKRNDSLAESSGGNTPDPASPFPMEGAKIGPDHHQHHHSVALNSPPPTTTATEESLPSIALIRRRTVSQSRFREVKEDAPSSIDYVEVSPYDLREFPLPDTDYQHMIEEVPDAHREIRTNYRAQDTGGDETLIIKDNNKTEESADSESTESAIGEDAIIDDIEDEHFMEEDEEDEEDPNDPEWTDAEKSSHSQRHHRR